MLHHARCVAAEQSSPSYLVLGMFKTSTVGVGGVIATQRHRKNPKTAILGLVVSRAIVRDIMGSV